MRENACQEFEIAIEMRRHGAANAESSRRLDAHLEGCASCGSFERLGAETDSRLRADAEAETGNIDLERLRARGKRLLQGNWSDSGAFFLLASIALAARITMRVAGIEQGEVGLQPALAIIAFSLPFVAMRRSQRELEEAWSSDVIFHFLRKHVDERLKSSIGLAAVGIAISIVFFIDRAAGVGAFPASLTSAIFVGCFGGLGLFILAVRVPRLLRERREIPIVPDPYISPPTTSAPGQS